MTEFKFFLDVRYYHSEYKWHDHRKDDILLTCKIILDKHKPHDTIFFKSFQTCVGTPQKKAEYKDLERKHLKQDRWQTKIKAQRRHRLNQVDNKHIDAPNIHPFQRISSQTVNRERDKFILITEIYYQDYTTDEYSMSWIPMNPLNI